LKSEIAQTRPFAGPAEEALLNLIRTADCLQRAMQHSTRRWNVTSTQYNVLRILRGAHPGGLACSAIGDRMIAADPDVTRLVARLKAQKLVRQARDKKDRRVVNTFISETGLALLAEMDPVVSQFPTQNLGHLTEEELTTLIHLVEKARSRCDNRHPPTCEGKDSQVSCDGKDLAISSNGEPQSEVKQRTASQ
jgi:DNA-binding MarR family transcriptional regulator